MAKVLPHIQGQGQKPGGPHAQGAAAKRSYPTSEVRGGGWEEITHAPKPEAKGSGGEEQPHDRGQRWWPGGPTPRPRSGICVGRAERSYSTLKVRGVAVRRYPSSKVKSSGCTLLEQP